MDLVIENKSVTGLVCLLLLRLDFIIYGQIQVCVEQRFRLLIQYSISTVIIVPSHSERSVHARI